MSKFKKGKKGKELPPISTASLPDIVFMLLCFFMVVTKMRETDIKVRTKVPQITELRKIENKSMNSFVFIGPPASQYQELMGTAPRIQLNDAFAKATDIMAFATARRAEIPPVQHNEMTVSLKVDGEVKMGLVTDVKTELRKANMRRVFYLANRRSEAKQ
jgi:biopolymer transport protein ExbD